MKEVCDDFYIYSPDIALVEGFRYLKLNIDYCKILFLMWLESNSECLHTQTTKTGWNTPYPIT